jgi:hypothetical protein
MSFTSSVISWVWILGMLIFGSTVNAFQIKDKVQMVAVSTAVQYLARSVVFHWTAVARAPSKQKRGSALTKAMRRSNQKVLSSQRKAAEAVAGPWTRERHRQGGSLWRGVALPLFATSLLLLLGCWLVGLTGKSTCGSLTPNSDAGKGRCSFCPPREWAFRLSTWLIGYTWGEELSLSSNTHDLMDLIFRIWGHMGHSFFLIAELLHPK